MQNLESIIDNFIEQRSPEALQEMFNNKLGFFVLDNNKWQPLNSWSLEFDKNQAVILYQKQNGIFTPYGLGFYGDNKNLKLDNNGLHSKRND